MTYYALKHDKHGLLGISVSSNEDDSEFCNPTTVSLEYGQEVVWITSNKKNAEEVIDGKGIPWYNSSIERPQLGSLKSKNIEVVEIKIL